MTEITEIVMAQDGLGETEDDWTIGIFSRETSPPRLLLGVGPRGGEKSRSWVGLGDTFAVGAKTWRFEDIRFRGTPNDYFVTLRRVPPGAPPFTPPPLVGDRVWNTVTIEHPGPVHEDHIARLEQEFDQRLPRLYRRWLAENNGGIPAEPAVIPGLLVIVDRHQPLLGIRPDQPYHDLRTGRSARGRMLNRDFVVIAAAANGLFAVKVDGPGLAKDTIVGLDNQSRSRSGGFQLAGYASREDYISAELVIPVAPDIYSFEAYLQPFAA